MEISENTLSTIPKEPTPFLDDSISFLNSGLVHTPSHIYITTITERKHGKNKNDLRVHNRHHSPCITYIFLLGTSICPELAMAVSMATRIPTVLTTLLQIVNRKQNLKLPIKKGQVNHLPIRIQGSLPPAHLASSTKIGGNKNLDSKFTRN